MITAKVIDISLPDPDAREILRYMGCKELNGELEALINKGLFECRGKVNARVVFAEYGALEDSGRLDLTFANTSSRDLGKALTGCDKILLFGATVGIEIDRLILKYGKISPSLALCIQAIGAERIEAVCDAFCRQMAEKYATEGYKLLPRFSPGYGDLPLCREPGGGSGSTAVHQCAQRHDHRHLLSGGLSVWPFKKRRRHLLCL